MILFSYSEFSEASKKYKQLLNLYMTKQYYQFDELPTTKKPQNLALLTGIVL